MSPWGHLLLTGWGALMAILTNGRWLAGLVLVETVLGLVWNRKGLQMLRQPRFWILILSVVALGPFLLGEPDTATGSLHLSRQGFKAGLDMAGRATALTLAFSLGVSSLSISDIVAIFDRVGLRGLCPRAPPPGQRSSRYLDSARSNRHAGSGMDLDLDRDHSARCVLRRTTRPPPEGCRPLRHHHVASLPAARKPC